MNPKRSVLRDVPLRLCQELKEVLQKSLVRGASKVQMELWRGNTESTKTSAGSFMVKYEENTHTRENQTMEPNKTNVLLENEKIIPTKLHESLGVPAASC